jgi:hypothetical protein
MVQRKGRAKRMRESMHLVQGALDLCSGFGAADTEPVLLFSRAALPAACTPFIALIEAGSDDVILFRLLP